MPLGKKIKELFNKPKEAEKEEKKAKEEEISKHFQLGEEEKKEIVETILLAIKDDTDARSAFMAIREESIKQYEGVKDPSNTPWEGHSNISSMVTTVACDLLHSKLFGMSWNEKSITWEGTESHDKEIAEYTKTGMSFIVSTDMKMQDQIDDIIHCLIVDGTVAVKKIWKSYWVYVTRKTQKKEITPRMLITGQPEYDIKYDYIKREKLFLEVRPLERVYFPYDANSSEPNWEDNSEHIGDERWYTLPQLRELQSQGVIEGSVNLDNLKANMDTLEEFGGTEKERMDAEGIVPVNTRKEQYKLKCYEAEMLRDVNKDGVRERCVFFICANPKMFLSGKPQHTVSRVGRSSWLIRPFLKRPGRAYGKGVPELVRHLHKHLDDRMNQSIDAVNMAIGGGGFYRSSSGVNPRRIIRGPATWIPVDDPQRDVYSPPFNLSGLQAGQAEIKIVMELIEKLTYLTPAQLGRETAQRPTARGTLAVIQMGEQKFALLGMRVQNIICSLLTDVRQKYEENMPPETWARIVGKIKPRGWLSPETMIGSYEAKMQLDLTALSPDADRQLAIMMFQSMSMDPLVIQNPAFMWEVRADYCKALKREPVEKYIGPKPQTEANMQDAEDVFTMLEQQQQNVPLGDPATLLPKLMELIQSPRGQRLTPEARMLFNDYIRKLKMNYVDTMNKGIEYARQGQGTPAGAGEARGLGGFNASMFPSGGGQGQPQRPVGTTPQGMPQRPELGRS